MSKHALAALVLAASLLDVAPRALGDAPPPPSTDEVLFAYTLHSLVPTPPPGPDRTLRLFIREGEALWSAGSHALPLSPPDLAIAREAIAQFERLLQRSPPAPQPLSPCPFPAQRTHTLTLGTHTASWRTPCDRDNPAAPTGLDGILATLDALTVNVLPDPYRLWLPTDPAGDYLLFTPMTPALGAAPDPQVMTLSRLTLRRAADEIGWTATYRSGSTQAAGGADLAATELHGVRVEIASFAADPIAVKTAWPGYLPRSFAGLFVEKYPGPNEKGPVERGIRLESGEFFVRAR